MTEHVFEARLATDENAHKRAQCIHCGLRQHNPIHTSGWQVEEPGFEAPRDDIEAPKMEMRESENWNWAGAKKQ